MAISRLIQFECAMTVALIVITIGCNDKFIDVFLFAKLKNGINFS